MGDFLHTLVVPPPIVGGIVTSVGTITMEVTVIDTLRYADRLKAAGIQANQAEAMSRALNEELTGGVATKDDIGHAVDTLDGKLADAVEHLETKIEGDIGRLETKIESEIGRLETKFESDIGRLETKIESDIGHAVAEMKGELDTMDAKFDAKFSAMDAKFDAKFNAMDGKFDAKINAMDGKFDAKFDAMDEKFDSLRDRVDSQGRYVFMVLALIAALGLYNAVSPHIAAKAPATADAKPAIGTAQTRDS